MSRPKAILGLEDLEDRFCPAVLGTGPFAKLSVVDALLSVTPSAATVAVSNNITAGESLARSLLTDIKNHTDGEAQYKFGADIQLMDNLIGSGNLERFHQAVSAGAQKVAEGGSRTDFYLAVGNEALALGFLLELDAEYEADYISALNAPVHPIRVDVNVQRVFADADAGMKNAESFIVGNLSGQTVGYAAIAFNNAPSQLVNVNYRFA